MKNDVENQQDAVVTVSVLGRLARNRCPHHVVAFALAFAGVTASLGVAKTAGADPNYLYLTSFEPSTFQAGDQLLGLDGWSTAARLKLNQEEK